MKITPNISDELKSKNASQIADYIFDEQARLVKTQTIKKDSTLILCELLIKHSLYWVTLTFNNFERSKLYLNKFFNTCGLPQNIIIGGLSVTHDGAFMVLGGDFRNYENAWIKLLDNMNQNKGQSGIITVKFPTY